MGVTAPALEEKKKTKLPRTDEVGFIAAQGTGHTQNQLFIVSFPREVS